MITARSSVVKLSPGRYQIATVLKGMIATGGYVSGREQPPYRLKRSAVVDERTRKEPWIARVLRDATVDDPDDMLELWIR
jgi:hypothetical protein